MYVLYIYTAVPCYIPLIPPPVSLLLEKFSPKHILLQPCRCSQQMKYLLVCELVSCVRCPHPNVWCMSWQCRRHLLFLQILGNILRSCFHKCQRSEDSFFVGCTLFRIIFGISVYETEITSYMEIINKIKASLYPFVQIGWSSLKITPSLCKTIKNTVAEKKKLYLLCAAIGKPNVTTLASSEEAWFSRLMHRNHAILIILCWISCKFVPYADPRNIKNAYCHD